MADHLSLTLIGVVGSFWNYTSHEDVLSEIRSAGDVKTIEVVINSPGGYYTQGIAIYNELVRHPATVTVRVRGMAASIASLVAMAANKIIIEPGSMLMIHNASAAVEGNKEYLADIAEHLSKCDYEMAKIYSKRTGRSMKAVREMMDAETWFSPEEAVKAGFADQMEEEGQADTNEQNDLQIAAIAPLLPQFGYARIPERVAALMKPNFLGKTEEFSNAIAGLEAVTDRKPDAASAGETQKKEKTIMAEDTKIETPVPKAASITEIKAVCKGAESDFILAQIEKGSTIEQVKDAWIDALAAKASAQAEELAKAKANIEPAQKPGVAALDASPDPKAEESVDPIKAWREELKAKTASGMPLAKAMSRLVAEQPDLHKAYIAAFNDSRR